MFLADLTWREVSVYLKEKNDLRNWGQVLQISHFLLSFFSIFSNLLRKKKLITETS